MDGNAIAQPLRVQYHPLEGSGIINISKSMVFEISDDMYWF